MEEDARDYWYNFITKKFDFRLAPGTDEEAKLYVSQSLSAQELYALYRQHKGLTILEAMTAVLRKELKEPMERLTEQG
jgi:hypothetical protein